MKSKKILVIYTGGTFGMSENLEIPDLSAKQLKARLESSVPEMKRIAQCTVRVLFNTDSCHMGLKDWVKIADTLRLESKNFDGAVVLHGTDTLAYTAAALSYLLAPTPIPIVLTGAQKPLSALRNDARTNFLTSLEVAAFAPKALRNRVMVAFHDELYLGSRIRKLSALRFSAFESPRFPSLAKVGSTIQYRNSIHHLPKLKTKRSPPLSNPLPKLPGPALLKIEVTPEFPGDLFSNGLLRSLDGILLTLFTSGTAPTENPSFVRFLKAARAASLPIFAITEREEAPLDLGSYEAGKKLVRLGVNWCHDLTPEAAFVKAELMHLTERVARKRSRSDYFNWLKRHWANALSDETSA